MRVRFLILIALATLLPGCLSPGRWPSSPRNDFIGLTNFSAFVASPGSAPGELVLTSPEITARNSWDELIVSWNVPAGVDLTMEARGVYPDHTTKFYTLGRWSDDPARHPRESVTNQADADGTVLTDTLRLRRPGAKVQLRVTLNGSAVDRTSLKFLGLSFCDTRVPAPPRKPNRAAWGRSLPVPERIQSGYDGPGGWCSPASLSMVLAYWSAVLHRPELDCPVPDVAAAVNDPVYGGTGNWPFNTAFAGEFPGLRAYVTRLDGLSEVEDCIAAGVPLVLSVSSYLTNDRHDGPDNGHLIVCIGFTKNGDVIVNDPGVSLKNGQLIGRIYPRARVLAAWQKSRNTAYLIYPEAITGASKP